ncbi:PucR family transcriptional regulator [Crossiella sp. NPDC003009]
MTSARLHEAHDVNVGRGADAGSVRALRVAGEQEQRLAEFRARVRTAGEQWAGARAGGLVELLREAAAGDPELAQLAQLGGQLLEDFVEGLGRKVVTSSPRDLAADLIDGTALPREVLDQLAPAYAVVLARFPAERRTELAALDLTGRGVLCTRRSGVLVLLVPGTEAELLDELTRQLAGDGWVATAKRAVAELAEGYAEARDVLRLVVAGRRPAGVYRVVDVLVEYALIGNEAITTRLAEIIRPLRDHPVLWETLVALQEADFSRNEAARSLFIHRSTLDYRLRRIAKVTGHDPSSGRGAQALSAALIADAVV